MTPAAPSSVGKLDAGRLWDFRRLTLESALAEITRLFEKRGVRALLLKGAGLAHWLYDDPRQRTYGDIDLLVAPDGFDAAMGALSELNFEARSATETIKERAAHHEQLTRHGTIPVEVELHHTLRLVLAPPSVLWQRLTEVSQTIEIAGTRVDVPSLPASALIVVLHAAQHVDGWLPPLNDLHRALDRVDLETWREASALAWDLGAGPVFAAGLRLDPIGRDVAKRLGLADTSPRLIRLLAAVPSNSALSVERLVSTPGVGARLRLLASEIVPPPDPVSDSSAPARRSGLGLVRAYLQRSFQLLRGAEAWLRAAVPLAGADPPRRQR